jgi:hypothetical protein
MRVRVVELKTLRAVLVRRPRCCVRSCQGPRPRPCLCPRS